MMFNLNVPILPEPLLRDDWESFAKLVWSSQKGLPSNRSYLMGWFYDAPFDSLREEGTCIKIEIEENIYYFIALFCLISLWYLSRCSDLPGLDETWYSS